MSTLRLILGDQLSHSLASLRDVDKEQDVILMAELWDEATYVNHHKKKIAFLFSAMRHFAAELEENGYRVEYTKLRDTTSFSEIIEAAITKHKPDKIIVTEAGEYRVLQEMLSWQEQFNIPVEIRADDRFLCSTQEFSDWAEGRKQLRMEYFYREMRKKYSILMDGDEPVGGKWNYDAENRKPPKEGLGIPPTYHSQPDAITQEAIALVADKFGDHFGDLEPFHFAVTNAQAK